VALIHFPIHKLISVSLWIVLRCHKHFKIPLSQIPTPMKDWFNNSALSESIVFKTPEASLTGALCLLSKRRFFRNTVIIINKTALYYYCRSIHEWIVCPHDYVPIHRNNEQCKYIYSPFIRSIRIHSSHGSPGPQIWNRQRFGALSAC